MRVPTLTILGYSIVTCLLSYNSAVADLQINPGEWKYKMKTKIKGLGIPLPSIPTKFSSCVTRTNPVMQTPEMKKAGCEVTSLETEGNQVVFTVRCTNADSVAETNYRNTYNGDTMEGTFDQVRTVSGKVETTATGTLTGKRIGECKTE